MGMDHPCAGAGALAQPRLRIEASSPPNAASRDPSSEYVQHSVVRAMTEVTDRQFS